MELMKLFLPTDGLNHLSVALLALILICYVTLRGLLFQGGLFVWITKMQFPLQKRVFQIPYPKRQIQSELQASVINILIDSMFFATLIKWNPLQPVQGNILATFWISFVWFEIWFYASHRLFHTPQLFFIHKQHHVAKITSPFSALSFSVLERIILLTGGIGVLFLLSFHIPISNVGVAIYLTTNYFLNLLGHLNVEIVPPRLLDFAFGRLLNTPTYHALHHARNKGHYSLFTPYLDILFNSSFDDYRDIQKMAFNKNGLKTIGQKIHRASPVALVTGASSGIGKALATEYAKAGYQVVVCARRVEILEQLAAELKDLPTKIIPVECDVRKRENLDFAVQQALTKFGRLDVVIANAGFGIYGNVSDLTFNDFKRQFETNVDGVLHTVQATIPVLKKSRGRLAIIGSAYSYFTFPTIAPYAMSKYAVRALAETLYYELKNDGVSVTMVCPGVIGTDFRKINNEGHHKVGAQEVMPSFMVMPANIAAQKIKSAIDCRRAEYTPTLHGKLGVWIRNHCPITYRKVISMMTNFISHFVKKELLN